MNMKEITNYKKQKGFSILAIILLVVAIITALSIWILSGQVNTSSSINNNKNDLLASAILNDSANIQLAFDTLLINGANSYNIIFSPNISSTSSSPNILDPLNGIVINSVNPDAFKYDPAHSNVFPSGKWNYNTGPFPNKGSNQADHYMNVVDIKDGVCASVNKILYGYNDIPITVFDLAHADWSIGCVRGDNATGPDQNVFYRILKAN